MIMLLTHNGPWWHSELELYVCYNYTSHTYMIHIEMMIQHVKILMVWTMGHHDMHVLINGMTVSQCGVSTATLLVPNKISL